MAINWLEPFDMFTMKNREVSQMFDEVTLRAGWTREEAYYLFGGIMDRQTDRYMHDFFTLRGVLY